MGDHPEFQPNIATDTAPEKLSFRNTVIGLVVGIFLYVVANAIPISTMHTGGWILGPILGAWRRPNNMPVRAVAFSALKWGLIIGAIFTIVWRLIEKSFAWRDQPVGLLVIWALAGAIAGACVVSGYEAQKYTGKYYYNFKDIRISVKRAYRVERRSMAIVIVGSAIVSVVFAYIFIL